MLDVGNLGSGSLIPWLRPAALGSRPICGVLGSSGEEEFVFGTARPSEAEAIQLQDLLEMGE